MKKNAIASLLLAFATAFALADNLGTASLVGDLSSTSDYVYTADQADAVFATRVPTNRTVNGHALTGNVTIGESDITVTPGGGSYTLSGWVDSVDSYLGQIVPDAGTMLLGIKDGKLIAGTSSAVQRDLNINGTNVIAAIQSASAEAKAYTDASAYTHPSYTAQTGKPTSDASPGFGDMFTISQITSDSTGHVTGATDRTITIPSTAATTSDAGLMSAADKTKLNGIAAGATKGFTKFKIRNTAENAWLNASANTEQDLIHRNGFDVSATTGGFIIDVKLTDSTSTSSSTTAASATAVKNALDSAKAYADSAVAAGAYTHPSYTARTGKPTANATPGWGGTFTVSQIKSDATGHVTDAVDRTITIPSAAATTSAAGLMSAADKTALDSLSSGAVIKTSVAAALTAQGVSSADNIDTLNETIAELKKVIAVLEALD